MNTGMLLITKDGNGVIAMGFGGEFPGLSLLFSILIFSLLSGPTTYARLTQYVAAQRPATPPDAAMV